MKYFDVKPKPKAVIQKLPKKIKLRAFVKKPSLPVISKPAKRGLKIIAGILILVLAVLAILAFLVLPEVRIEVQARTEPITRDFQIRVDKNQAAPNAAELAIPGKMYETELSQSKTFGATGTKNIGQKASGFVYIYNFSKTTLILKAGTTVLSQSGREYFFTQDVSNIRPTALIGLEDQEVDQSSLIPPVPVVAGQPGTQYNLPSGARLEISNEAFGSNSKTLYAIVAEDVSGGTNKEVKIVTETDIQSAHQSLSKELIAKAKKELAGKYGVTALDNSMAADVLEPTASVKAGAEANDFEVSLKVRVRAFAFSQEDVETLVRERVKRLLPDNRILQEGEQSRVSAQFANVSIDQGIGILVAHYQGSILFKVNREELIAKIKGKNVEEIREILLSRQEIESANIKFYPFWVKEAPRIAKKINLEVTAE